LGDASTQFISGSGGLLTISSSKFFVSSSGELFADEATITGVANADMFGYRNITTGAVSVFNNQEIFNVGSKDYIRLNLTGSSIGGISGTGPATFLRVNSTSGSLPIGHITIHDSKYDSPVGEHQKVGGFLIIETANGTGIDFVLNDPYVGSPARFRDSYIAYDGDDMIAPMLKTKTIGGVTYNNVLTCKSGTHILLVQSQFAWRILSLSTYDAGPVQFAGGLNTTEITATTTITTPSITVTGTTTSTTGSFGRITGTRLTSTVITGSDVRINGDLTLTSLPTSNPGGSGIVWNDGGILKIT